MAEGDAAFLWETEALRASRRAAPVDPPSRPPTRSGSWVTLREAYYRTGIPVETLRKWARRSTVPSYLDDGPLGVRRMVRMDAVHTRAVELGRPIEPVDRPPPPESPPRPGPDPEGQPDQGTAPTGTPAKSSFAPRREPDGSPPALPPDTMIVPVAAWDKMLMQLGNLHEAGQQLAEARERAARAETEATFLRERLGEMRRALEHGPAGASPPPAAEPMPDEPDPATANQTRPPGGPPVPAPEKLWRYVYRGWRSRRRSG